MVNKQLWIKTKDKFKSFIRLLIKINPITKARIVALGVYLRHSWKSIAIILPLVLVVYYSVGGYVTNTINKEQNISSVSQDKGLSMVDSLAYLIKREVDDNMWTPNLPFIFPGYVLDNMPAFQKGIMQSVKVSTKAMADVYQDARLFNAYELLKYPPNIWILSKGENLALAPSSGAQYRKAKKELVQFNKEFSFAAKDDNAILLKLVSVIEKNMSKVSKDLENQVQEFSSNWVDFKADDVFYYNQGRIYGFYIVLKALSVDFKTYIVNAKQYETLTKVLKYLEDGIEIAPLMIRNGKINGTMSANHLMSLNYYIAKAQYHLNQIKN